MLPCAVTFERFQSVRSGTRKSCNSVAISNCRTLRLATTAMFAPPEPADLSKAPLFEHI